MLSVGLFGNVNTANWKHISLIWQLPAVPVWKDPLCAGGLVTACRNRSASARWQPAIKQTQGACGWTQLVTVHLHGGEASHKGNEKTNAFTWQLVTVILFQVIPSKSFSSITLNPLYNFPLTCKKRSEKPRLSRAGVTQQDRSAVTHSIIREKQNKTPHHPQFEALVWFQYLHQWHDLNSASFIVLTRSLLPSLWWYRQKWFCSRNAEVMKNGVFVETNDETNVQLTGSGKLLHAKSPELIKSIKETLC